MAGKRMMLMLSMPGPEPYMMLMLSVPGHEPNPAVFSSSIQKSALVDKNVYPLLRDEESEVQKDTSALQQRNWNLNLPYLALNLRSDAQ